MRLEVGERVGQCKLWVTPAEQEALRLGDPESPPDLPKFVLEHLREHGHFAPLAPINGLNLPPTRPIFGLAVYVETATCESKAQPETSSANSPDASLKAGSS